MWFGSILLSISHSTVWESREFSQENHWYTQSQKNRNIFEVAFLLEKSLYQWICFYTSIIMVTTCQKCRFLVTLGHMTLTLGPRKNPRRKVAFLLRLSVFSLLQAKVRIFYLCVPTFMKFSDNHIKQIPLHGEQVYRQFYSAGHFKFK